MTTTNSSRAWPAQSEFCQTGHGAEAYPEFFICLLEPPAVALAGSDETCLEFRGIEVALGVEHAHEFGGVGNEASGHFACGLNEKVLPAV